jgi:hypothetical protein
MSAEPATPIVSGVNEQDFKLWKHHPVSKVVAQYFADFRGALVQQHLAEWLAGKTEEVRDLEIRGRVAQLDDIAELTFASMVTFYPGPDEEAEPATPEQL